LFDQLSHHAPIATLEHERHGDHRLALAIAGRSADPGHGVDLDLTQLGDGDRCAARADPHDDAQEVLRPFDQPFPSNQVCFAAVLNIATAGNGVVLLQRLEDAVDRDAVGDEPRPIDHHVILLGISTLGGDLGDPRDPSQPVGDLPVEDLSDLHGSVALALYHELIDFAQARGDRSKLRRPEANRDLFFRGNQSLGD